MKTVKKNYTEAIRDKSKRYYLLGLNLTEVSKLTDVPAKTLEKWQQKYKWSALRKPDYIKTLAKELKKSGIQTKKISEILKISTTTVWRYTK